MSLAATAQIQNWHNNSIAIEHLESPAMKYFITTQYRENYAAHDWDGKGECPQGWKFKGGSTYVIEGLSVAEALALVKAPERIHACIEGKDNYDETYIVDSGLLDDCESLPMDEWEYPIVFAWNENKQCLDCRQVAYYDESITTEWEQRAGRDRKAHREINGAVAA